MVEELENACSVAEGMKNLKVDLIFEIGNLEKEVIVFFPEDSLAWIEVLLINNRFVKVDLKIRPEKSSSELNLEYRHDLEGFVESNL